MQPFANPPVDSESIDAQIREGIQIYNQNSDEALRIANAALSSAREIGYYSGVAHALRLRAMTQGVRNEIALAEEDFLTALDWSQQLGDALLEARCRQGLATARRFHGEPAQALEEYYRAAALFRAVDNPVGLIHSLSSVGTVYGELGEYETSADYLLQALDIARKSDNESQTVHLLDSLGLVYEECGEREKALATFEQGIAVAESRNHLYGLCALLSNYATVLGRAGRYTEALPHAERSLSIANEFGGNRQRQIIALVSIAEICIGLGNLKEADEILADLLQGASRTPHLPGDEVNIWMIQGRVRTLRAQPDSAKMHLEKALSLALENGMKREISELHRLLSELYAAQNDYAAALEQHRLFHAAYMTLQKESTRNTLRAHTARYEAEQARREAERERHRNDELTAAYKRQNQLLLELEQQAIRDPLTGAFNRRYADDILDREMERVVAGSGTFSVALGDLDNFKQVNDRFSHRTGDQVLKAAAKLLQSISVFRHKNPCTIARHGGEEWLAILSDYNKEEAIVWAEAARIALRDFDWSQIAPEMPVSISFGVAEALHEMPESWEALLARADERLYRAKHAGKNRVIAN